MYTPAKTKQFEQAVSLAASSHLTERIDVAIRVDILAIASRPKRLMRKKDKDKLIYRTTKPDADNVRKAVLDGLSLFFDDKQVVAGDTLSLYCSKSGTGCVAVKITTDIEGPDVLIENLGLMIPLPQSQ